MYLQNDWTAIRKHYADRAEIINNCRASEWAIGPYSWDKGGMISMTPIEKNFWGDAREANLILYPQYPACGYFIDFANPVAKVGVECDGREFHSDKRRDERRQSVLEAAGWSIYRISGRECNQDWSEDGATPSPGYVLANQIGDMHGIRFIGSGKGVRSLHEVALHRIANLLERASA